MLLERLQKHTGLPRTLLNRYAETASKRYRTYEIEKRDGTMRPVHHPGREIKAIQRWLTRSLIRGLPIHEAATAYSKGAGIRKNAECHVQSRYTIRLDFEEFFPSFHGNHVVAYLTDAGVISDMVLSDADLEFVRLIVCRHGALTIGAPTSPGLTNAMMFCFDTAMMDWCTERNLIYTRYADDLFVSAKMPGALHEVEAKATEIAVAFPYANLKLNRKKTAHLSRRYRRSITGLVITPTQEISIGRAAKTRLKSAVYAFSKNELKPEDQSRTAGMIAFVRDVEPNFYATLVRKYGPAIIKSLQTGIRSSLKG